MEQVQDFRRSTEVRCRDTVRACDDERVVLRLAREPLRSNRPTVRFVDRLGQDRASAPAARRGMTPPRYDE
jgi:hypothetical protein